MIVPNRDTVSDVVVQPASRSIRKKNEEAAIRHEVRSSGKDVERLHMRPTLLDKSSMRWLLPDPVIGAFVGLGMGLMTCLSLAFLGVDLPGFAWVMFGLLGAIGGCVIGYLHQKPPGRGKAVGWWCATMTGIVGVVSFLLGFCGPMIFSPDSNTGPMLGIFVTGPLGAIVGAFCGVVIGLMVRRV
jgi:hypothetical protein